MTMSQLLVGSALHLGLCLGVQAAQDPQDAPKPASHTTRVIEGWPVLIDDRLLQPPNEELGTRILKSLEARLANIKAVVRPHCLAKLQGFSIVLDMTHGKLTSMQYHSEVDWLKENGYAADLVNCVHIPAAAELLDPGKINLQPWWVLHELVHAYHDRVLGLEEAGIGDTYARYKASVTGMPRCSSPVNASAITR